MKATAAAQKNVALNFELPWFKMASNSTSSSVKTHIKSTHEFSKYVTRNLENKRFKKDTPFGFNSQDEVIGIDGNDVRQWDDKKVKTLLKRGQGLFGHVFVIIIARPSGPNYAQIIASETVRRKYQY